MHGVFQGVENLDAAAFFWEGDESSGSTLLPIGLGDKPAIGGVADRLQDLIPHRLLTTFSLKWQGRFLGTMVPALCGLRFHAQWPM